MRTSQADRRMRNLLSPTDAGAAWITRTGARSLVEPALGIVCAAAAYGAAMGAWRDPLLACYVAIKLPVLLLAVAAVNGLANGLVAARLGAQLTIVQSARAVLAALFVAALVLAVCAPVFMQFALTLPHGDDAAGRAAHDGLGLAHVAAIATAGTAATLRQARWVSSASRSRARAGALVLVWLGVNLLAGAQLAWILRPWFGTPGLAVQFLRAHPFDGTFYESVLHMLTRL